MKIAFVSKFDPLDKYSWSGTYSGIYRAVAKHCGEVSIIRPETAFLDKLLGWFSSRSHRAVGKYYDWTRSVILALRHGAWLRRRLAGQPFDVIFSPAGSSQLAFLKTAIPIVYSSDTTFSLIKDLYEEHLQFLPIFLREAHYLERQAIQRASALVYPSAWAAESAVRDYGANPRKVHVFPYGANLEAIPGRHELPLKTTSGPCRLLFLGVSWERKGGAIAFAAFKELQRMGVAAELTVCGCIPPVGFADPHLTVIPFLDKNDKAQEARLTGLLREAHFLLLPTRGDCFGIVFCEASAFGVPSIATRTGGVPGAVHDGINGYLLSLEAGGLDYAQLMAALFGDPGRYRELCRTSREDYEQNLNWDAWGARMKQIIEGLVR